MALQNHLQTYYLCELNNKAEPQTNMLCNCNKLQTLPLRIHRFKKLNLWGVNIVTNSGIGDFYPSEVAGLQYPSSEDSMVNEQQWWKM